jgi:hypothetical protein
MAMASSTVSFFESSNKRAVFEGCTCVNGLSAQGGFIVMAALHSGHRHYIA